jgi:hypothetical protein
LLYLIQAAHTSFLEKLGNKISAGIQTFGNQVSAGFNAIGSGLMTVADKVGDALHWIGDGLMQGGQNLFGKNPNILGHLGKAWSQSGWLGKAALTLVAPFAYAGHVLYNTTAMVAGTLMQPAAPIDYTWGILGTSLGLGFGLLQILAGGEARVRNGTVQFKNAPLMGAAAGLSLGSVLFGGPGSGIYSPFGDWGHEYGHTVQNRVLGPFQLLVMGTSLGSAVWQGMSSQPLFQSLGFNQHNHHTFITETWADKWGKPEYQRRLQDLK